MEWKNLYRGFLMGTSDLVPGVSGGTIAMILGIYDRLLKAISDLFSKEWKDPLRFLIPLLLGILSALILLSNLFQYLLQHYFEPTQFFFLGLIIGAIPLLLTQMEAKKHLRFRHLLVLLITASILASIAFLNPDQRAEPITTLSMITVSGLFVSGWIAGMAMLLPGISGSLVLLLLGVYPTAIHALSTLNLFMLFIIGSGIVIGFFISSKGIRFLMSRYPYMTYAVMIGLIIGSIFNIFPGTVTDLNAILLCTATFGLGFISTFRIGRRIKPEYNLQQRHDK